MKSTPFFSRSFNIGRVVKITSLSILVLLILFTVGYFGFDSTLNLYTNYSKGINKENVLGVDCNKDQTDLSDSDDILTDYTKWLYDEADRIVWTYDLPGEEIKPLVQIPELKYEEGSDKAIAMYELSNGETIKVECSKVEEHDKQPYDIGSCDVLLNDTKSLTTWGWTNNKDIDVHITIFDDKRLVNPLIILSESFASGSRDDLSVYAISTSGLVNLQFNDNGKETKTWFSQPYSKMFVENNNTFLVTYFHDPSMMEKSLTRVWQLEGYWLKLLEAILERGAILN